MAARSSKARNPIFVMQGKEKFEEVPDFGFVARPEKERRSSGPGRGPPASSTS